MLKQALTSITFRQLSASTIIDLAASASIDAIEWGGDIHVPHGDVQTARHVRQMTEAAGLYTCAYGSYYRAGTHGDAASAFAPVLDTAIALGAGIVRVWAGNKGSQEHTKADTAQLVDALSSIVSMAEKQGARVALEYHRKTYTDTLDTTLFLLHSVPGLRTFWQPPVGMPPADNLHAMARLQGFVESLHVFEWTETGERRQLSEGSAHWPAYLQMVAQLPSTHHATTEFVMGDDPQQFIADAHALRHFIEQAHQVDIKSEDCI